MIYACEHCLQTFNPEASTALEFTNFCSRQCEQQKEEQTDGE